MRPAKCEAYHTRIGRRTAARAATTPLTGRKLCAQSHHEGPGRAASPPRFETVYASIALRQVRAGVHKPVIGLRCES